MCGTHQNLTITTLATLVLLAGEFGRTPRVNNIGSRDHWPHCYFSVWAGGGVQPGRVVGESDQHAEHPLTEPITTAMVGTTILELAGMSTARRARAFLTMKVPVFLVPYGKVVYGINPDKKPE